MIHAGSLRHSVVFEDQVETRDDFGQLQNSWTRAFSARVNIEPLRGDEFMDAQQTNARLTHRVVMRYRPDVTHTQRIAFKGRYFNINSIRNFQERDRKLTLMCEEIVS